MHLDIKWLWNWYILQVQDLKSMKSSKLLDKVLLKLYNLNLNLNQEKY